MRSARLRHNGTEKLLILALGWGQDAESWEHLPWPTDRDVLALYRWDDPATPAIPTGYACYDLLAWSFGVWRAATIPWPVRFHRATAVNGTLHPVDDGMGIPTAIFEGTLSGWKPGITAAKFWRRMDPGAGGRPLRTDASLLRELRYFAGEFRRGRSCTLHYDLAVIGDRDRIFPPENQAAAWKESGVPAFRMDLPHDPGAKITELADLGR